MPVICRRFKGAALQTKRYGAGAPLGLTSKVGFREIIPFEQKLGLIALGASVGKAIPHVELCRMPPLP
jgi:hypothetical protein